MNTIRPNRLARIGSVLLIGLALSASAPARSQTPAPPAPAPETPALPEWATLPEKPARLGEVRLRTGALQLGDTDTARLASPAGRLFLLEVVAWCGSDLESPVPVLDESAERWLVGTARRGQLWQRLPAGAPLRARPDGPVVGRVLRPFDAVLVETQDPGCELARFTLPVDGTVPSGAAWSPWIPHEALSETAPAAAPPPEWADPPGRPLEPTCDTALTLRDEPGGWPILALGLCDLPATPPRVLAEKDGWAQVWLAFGDPPQWAVAAWTPAAALEAAATHMCGCESPLRHLPGVGRLTRVGKRPTQVKTTARRDLPLYVVPEATSSPVGVLHPSELVYVAAELPLVQTGRETFLPVSIGPDAARLYVPFAAELFDTTVVPGE
jgi:hypothetical protein